MGAHCRRCITAISAQFAKSLLVTFQGHSQKGDFEEQSKVGSACAAPTTERL